MTRHQFANVFVGAWSILFAIFIFWALCGIAGYKFNPIFSSAVTPAAAAWELMKYIIAVEIMCDVHMALQFFLINNRIGATASKGEKAWDVITSIFPLVVILLSLFFGGKWLYWHWYVAVRIIVAVAFDVAATVQWWKTHVT